jgi:surface polysaccharide O-acyltransferase-like enzyme
MYIIEQGTGNREQGTGNREPFTTRNLYIDLLRIAATFGVIILHTSASNWYSTPVKSFNWQMMNLYDSLVRWTVPVFVMISGMLHLQSYNIKDNFCEEKYKICQKILRIICAIIFWTIIYNMFFPLVKYLFKDRNLIILLGVIKSLPGKIIFGPGWYHLWYLYMIMGLYLITPIIIRFINNAQEEHIKYALILFFVFGTCIQLYNTVNIIFDNIIAWLPTSDLYFPFPEITGYTGYYIAGYYFSKYDTERRNKILLYIFAILSMLFTILGCSLWSIYKNEPRGDFCGNNLPNTMFIAFALFVLLKNISSAKFFEKYKRIIIFVSEHTFGIYLVHDLLLQIIGRIGLNSLTFNPMLSIPVIAIIDFSIGLFITIIIKKIPFLKKYVV